MATAIDLELAYDWVKRCGSIASKLSADVGYLGTGHAPESAWTASGDDVRDVVDKIADQLDRAPTVLELARGHVETCHKALVELNRNNVAGYRAGGKLYLHAHGAIVGIASTLCTVVRGWDDRVEAPLRGEPVPPVERSLLRENLPECAKWFITDEMWVSYDEIQELLHHAEREHILAESAAMSEAPSVPTPPSEKLLPAANSVTSGKTPVEQIPPERRSPATTLRKAAKLLGKPNEDSGVRCIKQCIADGTIRAEEMSRQSYVFDRAQFPDGSWPNHNSR